MSCLYHMWKNCLYLIWTKCFCLYYIQKICLHVIQIKRFCLYQLQKCFLSILHMDNLSTYHIEKLSIPHVDKSFCLYDIYTIYIWYRQNNQVYIRHRKKILSLLNMDNQSIQRIDNFFPTLCIDKMSICNIEKETFVYT